MPDDEVYVDPVHRFTGLDGPTEDPATLTARDEELLAKVDQRKRQPLAQPRQPRAGNGAEPRRTTELIGALEGLRKAKPQRGGRWGQACCPAHEDDNPSLGWRVMDDGTVMLSCLAGCPKDAILSALGGFTLRDLFPSDSSVSRYGRARLFAYQNQQGELMLKSRDFAVADKHKAIQTETGFQFQEALPYGSGWLEGTDDTVVVVEGERDAHTLKELGIPVLALPGAGWRASGRALNLFVGRTVWLWHDDDDAGVRAMDALAESVREQAVGIRVVRLTSLPAGAKDVSDVFAAGGADEVVRVLGEAEPWTSSRGEPEAEPEVEADDGDVWLTAHEYIKHVGSTELTYLLGGCIPEFSLIVWSGLPKTMKSMAALDLGFAMLQERPFLGLTTGHVEAVAYLSEEQGDVDVAMRLESFLSLGDVGDRVRIGRWADIKLSPKYLSAWKERLGEFLGRRTLLIVDPLRDFLLSGSEKDDEVIREVKDVLRALMRWHGALTVVLLHHNTKAQAYGDDRDQSGSGALSAMADVLVQQRVSNGKDDEDDEEESESLALAVATTKSGTLTFKGRSIGEVRLRWQWTSGVPSFSRKVDVLGGALRMLAASPSGLKLHELTDGLLGVGASKRRSADGKHYPDNDRVRKVLLGLAEKGRVTSTVSGEAGSVVVWRLV